MRKRQASSKLFEISSGDEEMSDEINPYAYQIRVADALLAGRSVILQAPTGAGKTAAALLPFIHAIQHLPPNQFPRQCIYSVPMRVLANQFQAEYEKLTQRSGLKNRLQVMIHTGERPDDPELHGDLVFTTIDQTLSNVLGVPYALGSGRANLNAGAVIGSYLVFDEFHLYPHGEKSSSIGALKTTLQILKLLQGITPFVLMTATFSSAMLKELKAELGAEVVPDPDKPDELQKILEIPSQRNKVRRYHVVKDLLSADAVLQRHHTRSIAICNTVERAQALFQALRDHPARGAAQVILLHARFTASDRKKKEEFIREQFGKDSGKRTAPSVILVATQVIEVGLDITCENLHTEIAPANAIFQRAGRCARFENEQGDVFIYDVPLNKKGERNFMPYTRIEATLCESAWEAFLKRDGTVLDFYGEQQVIDEVHTEADRELLNSMREGEREIWDKIHSAMILGDVTTRRELIRDSNDSRTILVHSEPEKLDHPFRYRGFSLFIGSLLGKFEQLQQWQKEKGLDWVFKYPVEKPDTREEDARTVIEYNWHPAWTEEHFTCSPLLVVHPAFVEYDAEMGFRFSADGDPTRNDLNERAPRPPRENEFKYQLEDYPTHIGKMTRVFESRWRDRVVFAAARLEQAQSWPGGSVERAARMAIACHDLGKLDVRWQKWARKYQEAIGEPVADPSLMIVHTHNENDKHREIEKTIKPGRPHHAGEGAIAVAKIVHAFFSDASNAREALCRITLTAIARHHSAQTDSFEEYRLAEAAREALYAALHSAGIMIPQEAMRELISVAPQTDLQKQILRDDDAGKWWLAYFLIIRALRMSDGESQEET
jgi:CRISPR-associated endonuclease/helicase Cas3